MDQKLGGTTALSGKKSGILYKPCVAIANDHL